MNTITSNLKASAAIAGFVFTAAQASAQVVFDDGKMHIIDDDSYASERIEVKNGSKLKILDGAVISALIGTNLESAIQLFDNSLLIIQDGVFGAEKDGPEFENNWFSGTIAAYDQARIVIQGGAFGASSFRSGMMAMHDDSMLNISGGVFTNDGGSGGRIELYGQAECRISEGLFGSAILPSDNSTLKISGGMFGKDNPGGRPLVFRGRVSATGTSTVRISGGYFGVGTGFVILSGALFAGEAAKVEISGGTFTGNPAFGNGVVALQSPDVEANITGGSFDGTVISVEAGHATLKGEMFSLPFGPVDDLSTPLLGILSNGDPIDVTLTRADSTDASIELVED